MQQVEERFDGCQQTSEGGALLLRYASRKMGLLPPLAGCFTERRGLERIQHELGEKLAQHLSALAPGNEDPNSHEELRHDPLLALLAGKRELNEPLAGKGALNRLELTRGASALAEGADSPARGFRLLPREADGVVRKHDNEAKWKKPVEPEVASEADGGEN